MRRLQRGIARHGEDGPWTLANIRLVDSAGGAHLLDLADYTTQAYPIGEFESLPGPGSTPSPGCGTPLRRRRAVRLRSGFEGTTAVHFGAARRSSGADRQRHPATVHPLQTGAPGEDRQATVLSTRAWT